MYLIQKIQILKFEKLQPSNIWSFCFKNDYNDYNWSIYQLMIATLHFCKTHIGKYPFLESSLVKQLCPFFHLSITPSYDTDGEFIISLNSDFW